MYRTLSTRRERWYAMIMALHGETRNRAEIASGPKAIVVINRTPFCGKDCWLASILQISKFSHTWHDLCLTINSTIDRQMIKDVDNIIIRNALYNICVFNVFWILIHFSIIIFNFTKEYGRYTNDDSTLNFMIERN